jgi:hypothetical protein
VIPISYKTLTGSVNPQRKYLLNFLVELNAVGFSLTPTETDPIGICLASTESGE